jgi:GNAT superfamily N-acetyltransferase
MTLDALAVRVRRADAGDATMLAELGARTFLEAFGPDNRPEDLAAHLAKTYGVAIQSRELSDPATTYLVAEVKAVPAGYALVREGHAPPCVTGVRPLEIARFYVDRPWHGTGVAATLMEACDAEARRRRAGVLWLGVWEHNPRAIRFYAKSGFRDVGAHTFYVGTDSQSDRVMARELPEGSISGGAGE